MSGVKQDPGVPASENSDQHINLKVRSNVTLHFHGLFRYLILSLLGLVGLGSLFQDQTIYSCKHSFLFCSHGGACISYLISHLIRLVPKTHECLL